MKVIKLKPLEWVNIDITPRKLKITNTGYTGNTYVLYFIIPKQLL